MQDGIDQGPAFVAGSGMDDQPGGFVHCDQVIIFVEDVKRDWLWFDSGWLGRGYGDADAVVKIEPLRWFGGALVHLDIALSYPALDFGAGVLGKMFGEIAIQAVARLAYGELDGHVADVSRGAPLCGCPDVGRSMQKTPGIKASASSFVVSDERGSCLVGEGFLFGLLFAFFEQHEDGQKDGADDKGAIRHVEGGEIKNAGNTETYEIDHMAVGQTIVKVPGRTAEHHPQADVDDHRAVPLAETVDKDGDNGGGRHDFEYVSAAAEHAKRHTGVGGVEKGEVGSESRNQRPTFVKFQIIEHPGLAQTVEQENQRPDGNDGEYRTCAGGQVKDSLELWLRSPCSKALGPGAGLPDTSRLRWHIMQ